MNELLTINFDNQTISARELHDKVGSSERFSTWFERQLQYGFEEDIDYVGCKTFNTLAHQELQDFNVSIDMAKQICMIQKNDKAKQIRQYLINLERAWNTPEQVMARALKMADATIKELSLKVEEMKPKADYCEKILESTNTMLVTQIAQDYGMSAIAFNKILHEFGIQRKVNGQWILYEPYLSKKYTKSHTHSYERTDGSKGSRPNTEWTQEGRKFLYHFLKEHNILPLIEREG